MRQLILGVAVSLDGLIEGPNGEYDWCFTDQDYGMEAFLNRIDCIFYGRKSYEVAGGNIFPAKHAYVFSNTLKKTPKDSTLVSGDIPGQVLNLKKQKGKDIWLFGGAILTATLLNADLIDELWLSVHPILLGAGKPLFQHVEARKQFRLSEVKSYNTGLVSLHYRKA